MKKIILGVSCLIVSFFVAYFGVKTQYYGIQMWSAIMAMFLIVSGFCLIETGLDN